MKMLREARVMQENRFSTEAELGPLVEGWLRDQGSTCIGREVEIGFGIPDLMAGFGTRASLRNRRRQSGPIRHSLQLGLLEFCRTAKTEAELRLWAKGSYYELTRRAIRPLFEDDLLVRQGAGIRSRTNPKDPFERLVAVELKLTDINRGLAQAHAYRAFAEASYLALPIQRVNAKVMDAARSIGVGLLAVHRGHVEEVVAPDRVSLATTRRRRMASEHTLHASTQSASRIAGAAPRT